MLSKHVKLMPGNFIPLCTYVLMGDRIPLFLQGNLILSDIGLAEKRVYHAALNGNNSMPTVFHQKDD